MADPSAVQAPPETRLLPDGPTDGITALKYLSETLLASASWDGCVRVHSSSANALVWSHALGVPLLSLAAATDASSSSPTDPSSVTLFAGGLDGTVHLIRLEVVHPPPSATSPPTLSSREPPLPLGKHEEAVSCLCAYKCGTSWLVASAGWDRKWKLWEVGSVPGSPPNALAAPAAELELPGKAFSMDVSPNKSADVLKDDAASSPLPRFAVATSGRRIVFVDVTRLAEEGEALPADKSAFAATVSLDRESSLKYQTRSVRLFPDGTGLAVASIEGRVAVEYMSELHVAPHPDSGGGKKYAFKCHRQGDSVYPVNSLAFRPLYPGAGTPPPACAFATGGCDGTVALWDGFAKRKLLSLPAFPASIAALAFSPSGRELAVASSYTFEEGEREHPRDEIYLRPVQEWELLPKKQ